MAYIEQDRIVTIDPVFSDEGTQTNAIWGLDRIDQRNLPLAAVTHTTMTAQVHGLRYRYWCREQS